MLGCRWHPVNSLSFPVVSAKSVLPKPQLPASAISAATTTASNRPAPETGKVPDQSQRCLSERASAVQLLSLCVSINSNTHMSTPNRNVAKPAADPNPQNPTPGKPSEAELREAMRIRAEEIYEKSGRIPGRDLQNWFLAEAEIRRETATRTARKPAVVVNVEGVQYVGEYDSALASGYTPGEFVAGDPVRVRFESGKMLVIRPNGQHLETTIINRVG